MPGKTTVEQAAHFAKALARGQPERIKIITSVAVDKVREHV
jgi:pyruvate dehydrogenase (quinone)